MNCMMKAQLSLKCLSLSCVHLSQSDSECYEHAVILFVSLSLSLSPVGCLHDIMVV